MNPTLKQFFSQKHFQGKFLWHLIPVLLALFLHCSKERPYYNKNYFKLTNSSIRNLKNINFSFFILGDTGHPREKNDEVLATLYHFLSKQNPEQTRTFLLGDNVYPIGLPDKTENNYNTMLDRLNLQLDVFIKLNQKAVFIPGNHDWNLSGKNGARYIKNQADYLNNHSSGLFTFLPKDVNPGPAVLKFPGQIKVIIMDSEWFMHDDNQKKKKILKTSLAKLQKELATGNPKKNFLLAHHPLYSSGRHGGYLSWNEYVSPPFIGFLKVMYRKLHKGRSDIKHERYKRYTNYINPLVQKNPPFIYIAGHDHSLQLMKNIGPLAYHIISGGGMINHITPAGQKKESLFAAGKAGFMILDFYKNGKSSLSIITVDEKNEKQKKVNINKLIKKKIYFSYL